ncbi:hypothetical protein [Singulisphaera sp. PoT]|uniref:hypothetical protein n=1 Tax=Singulisphaera sp. PoT TaxID=3411797 RepID=UPI003BF4F009
MAETPRRDDLPSYWGAVVDDLEDRINDLCRRLERSRQRIKTQREACSLERAKNLLLRLQVKRLEEQVQSLGGKTRD